jgi:hypothetical protein
MYRKSEREKNSSGSQMIILKPLFYQASRVNKPTFKSFDVRCRRSKKVHRCEDDFIGVSLRCLKALSGKFAKNFIHQFPNSR